MSTIKVDRIARIGGFHPPDIKLARGATLYATIANHAAIYGSMNVSSMQDLSAGRLNLMRISPFMSSNEHARSACCGWPSTTWAGCYHHLYSYITYESHYHYEGNAVLTDAVYMNIANFGRLE
jgi:hypothetical protein